MLKKLINNLSLTKVNIIFVSILLIVWLICPEILGYRVFDNLISLLDLVSIFLIALAIFQIVEIYNKRKGK